MFKSLKSFIDSRLGTGIVIEDVTNDAGYFVRIHPRQLYSVIFFLKHDPDVRLTLLDQVIALPSSCVSWWHQKNHRSELAILYQLKSLKLPYRVTVGIEFDRSSDTIPSIASLYIGARWQEIDIGNTYGITIEDDGRDRS